MVIKYFIKRFGGTRWHAVAEWDPQGIHDLKKVGNHCSRFYTRNSKQIKNYARRNSNYAQLIKAKTCLIKHGGAGIDPVSMLLSFHDLSENVTETNYVLNRVQFSRLPQYFCSIGNRFLIIRLFHNYL